MELGVNISIDPNQAAADVVLAASIGAKWVRTSQEQTWGTSRLTIFRQVCDDHGIKLWNTNQSVNHKIVTSQSDLDAWGESCAAYAAIADCTGIGNEDNGFGSNDIHPDPVARAEMTLAAIEWRDKLSPGRQLCTPELCPAGGTDPTDTYIEPLLYFQTYIHAQPSILKAKKLWIGWHPYCDARYPANTAQTWNTAYRMRALRQYLDSLGSVGNKKICGTEFGAATGPLSFAQKVDPNTQAQRFDDYISEFRSQAKMGSKMGPFMWYQLRDTTPNDWTTYCGLFDIHGQAKPIAARFALAAKGK